MQQHGVVHLFNADQLHDQKGFTIDDFPRSVIIINWLLALTVIITTRTLARFIFNEYDIFIIQFI